MLGCSHGRTGERVFDPFAALAPCTASWPEDAARRYSQRRFLPRQPRKRRPIRPIRMRSSQRRRLPKRPATPMPSRSRSRDPAGSRPEGTIVVTGIRRSIQDSLAIKRRESSVVEAVSAEEIGKLPDVSIAESIARLPGVAAQRVAGRAQIISVRGFSPDFTTVLLNGRQQASSGYNRGVEFDQYPSELLARSSSTKRRTPTSQGWVSPAPST